VSNWERWTFLQSWRLLLVGTGRRGLVGGVQGGVVLKNAPVLLGSYCSGEIELRKVSMAFLWLALRLPHQMMCTVMGCQ